MLLNCGKYRILNIKTKQKNINIQSYKIEYSKYICQQILFNSNNLSQNINILMVYVKSMFKIQINSKTQINKIHLIITELPPL